MIIACITASLEAPSNIVSTCRNRSILRRLIRHKSVSVRKCNTEARLSFRTRYIYDEKKYQIFKYVRKNVV